MRRISNRSEPGILVKRLQDFVPVRRGLDSHLQHMTDAESKLYLHLLLRADHRSGVVRQSLGDIAAALAWSISKVSRTIPPMTRPTQVRPAYIIVRPAVNQHGLTEITIIKYPATDPTSYPQAVDNSVDSASAVALVTPAVPSAVAFSACAVALVRQPLQQHTVCEQRECPANKLYKNKGRCTAQTLFLIWQKKTKKDPSDAQWATIRGLVMTYGLEAVEQALKDEPARDGLTLLVDVGQRLAGV